jgi:CubicO group peptidase (beta-lactamase class C family)
MQSGLQLGNSLEAGLYSLWAPSNRMLFTERDMAGFAARAALAAAPGRAWNYADGSYLILSRILRDAVGGDAAAVREFADRELFGPLGMRRVVLGFDATGTPVGATKMLASARDWARLGMLYLQDGVVAGRRLLPNGWVEYSAAPTPGAWIGYGAGFWTNRDASFGAQRRISLGMPRDAFFGRGMFGQFVVVVPSARLVVVRLGTAHGDQETEGVSRLVADIVAALRGFTT